MGKALDRRIRKLEQAAGGLPCQKPGKRWVSHNRRCFRIPKSCQISSPLKPSILARTQMISSLLLPIREGDDPKMS